MVFHTPTPSISDQQDLATFPHPSFFALLLQVSQYMVIILFTDATSYQLCETNPMLSKSASETVELTLPDRVQLPYLQLAEVTHIVATKFEAYRVVRDDETQPLTYVQRTYKPRQKSHNRS